MTFTPALLAAKIPNTMGATTQAPALNAIIPSTYICSAVSLATARTITLPQGTRYINITSEQACYVDFNGQTAVVPASTQSTGGAAVLNPGVRYVGDLCVSGTYAISIIAAGAGNATIECWA